MTSQFDELVNRTRAEINTYKPLFFRLSDAFHQKEFIQLIDSGKVLYIHDQLEGQLKELIKMGDPAVKIKPEDYPALIQSHLHGIEPAVYGVWVFYPWNGRLVHILDEKEFIKVRTNRNQYKITEAEQQILSEKRIGIVGLSVGQSIALTLSMERGFGELRLADFDTLELSNLNRIRAGIHNLGVPKVVVTAREIAEIDPFLIVNCFFEGLIEENMMNFFTSGGNLHLLVDECDSLDVKILARYKARELKIPVLMDTSDRGMLDVERFDLDPNRSILHGMIEDVDPATIKDLNTDEKIPVMLQMLGIENISLRAKVSMLEVEQTINTWPQLASSVALGGAIGADVSRRILLDQFHQSGRYYIDLDQLVSDPDRGETTFSHIHNPHLPITLKVMEEIVDTIITGNHSDQVFPGAEQINLMVEAAGAAPSTGNDQPWKWFHKNGILYLFLDESRAFSFGDFKKTASFISLGAAFENLYLKGLELGLEAEYVFNPAPNNRELAAYVIFRKASSNSNLNTLKKLNESIFRRHTNRVLAPRVTFENDVFDRLSSITKTIPGTNVKFFTSVQDLRGLASIIGACDRMRLLHPDGHYDFVHREMRWTSDDAEKSMDGIDIRTLGLGHSLQAALNVIREVEVIEKLKDLGGGGALGMLAVRTVSTASAICMISVPGYSLENFFKGGRAMQRFWLEATELNIAVHPLISPLYLFSRLLHGGDGLETKDLKELEILRDQFRKITQCEDTDSEIFLVKLAIAPEPEIKSFRLPLKDILING